MNITNDCVSITKALVMKGVKLMTERYKKYMKSKGQLQRQIMTTEAIHIFSCKTKIGKHLT